MNRFSGSVSTSKCPCCAKTAYPTEAVDVDGAKYHKMCFKCVTCGVALSLSTFSTAEGKVYCRRDVPKAVPKAGTQSIALIKQMEAQKLTSEAVGSPDVVARYAKKDASAAASAADAPPAAPGSPPPASPAKATPAKEPPSPKKEEAAAPSPARG